MRLKNKVALITGSASGIGQGVAEGFSEEGAKIIVADNNLKAAEAVADGIIKKGGEAIAVHMDVTDEDQVEKGVALGVSHFNGIDILMSNAGIPLLISSIEKIPFSEWKKMLDIQLNGAFLTTRACLKEMYQRGKGGNIIYTGSIHSKDASIQQFKSSYVTAKHGLLGLCRVVAKEGAEHKVRANIICPAFVRTPLVEAQIPHQAKAFGVSEEELVKKFWLKDTVDGEFTTIEDIVQVVLFIVTYPSGAITGQSFFINHGWTMP